MLCRMRCASSWFGVFAGEPGRSTVASFSLSPASTRSSLTPGRLAVALAPGAIRPDALAIRATVPFGVCRYPGAVASATFIPCLLYTSDAADDLLCVDLGG